MTIRSGSRLPLSLSTLTARIFFSLAVGAVMLLFTFQFVEVVRVSGSSMNPTLQNGQLLLSLKYTENYQQGTVVVFRPPRDLQTRVPRFIKRLIAVPGDTVSIQNDTVYLNGKILAEPYVTKTTTRAENFPELIISKGEIVAFEGFALAELPAYLKDTLVMLEPLPKAILEKSYSENVSTVGTIKLPRDYYFVLGDNRGYSASEDSRLFGVISRQNLLGTVKVLTP